MNILPKNLHKAGLIGHVICNYPSEDLCKASLQIMKNCGVALAEIQIPCSEPIADGPLFMKANHQAIRQGVKVEDVFSILPYCAELPKVVMTYVNIIYKYGLESFLEKAANNGVKGFIIPDLPVELATDFLAACHRYELAWIPIVTPTMKMDRLEQVLNKGAGFVYAVSRAGVTGHKSEINKELFDYLRLIRDYTDLPIAVGFGISTKSDVEQLNGIADYAIIGSAALRALKENGGEGAFKILAGHDLFLKFVRSKKLLTF